MDRRPNVKEICASRPTPGPTARRALPLLLASALLLAPACTETGTEIMLSVASDMRVPLELDSMRIEIRHVARQVIRDYSLDPAKADHARLPATLGLVGGEHHNEPLLITVTGKKAGKAIVQRLARLPWVEGRILLLRMNLLRRCIMTSTACAKDETCTEHGCEKPDVDPGALPDYIPGATHTGLDLSIPDGLGLDGGAPDMVKKPDGPVAKDGPTPDQLKPDKTAPDLLKPDLKVLPKVGIWVTLNKTPPATFKMGAPSSEKCYPQPASSVNEYQHTVTLTRSFEIYNTEVTQAEFVAEMGYTPSWYNAACGGTCPAEEIAWYEAAAYCNALSKKKSLTACYTCTGSGATIECVASTAYSSGGKTIYDCPGYRLPTEAEWEYAYRAGTQTAYYNGPNKDCYLQDANLLPIAWHTHNATSTRPVGTRAPNAWGLYDMAGNAHEYTQDVYVQDLGTSAATDPLTTGAAGAKIVIRGGWFGANPRECRAAYRAQYGVDGGGSAAGFRCVRTLP